MPNANDRPRLPHIVLRDGHRTASDNLSPSFRVVASRGSNHGRTARWLRTRPLMGRTRASRTASLAGQSLSGSPVTFEGVAQHERLVHRRCDLQSCSPSMLTLLVKAAVSVQRPLAELSDQVAKLVTMGELAAPLLRKNGSIGAQEQCTLLEGTVCELTPPRPS
jgi:hypothetical protein